MRKGRAFLFRSVFLSLCPCPSLHTTTLDGFLLGSVPLICTEAHVSFLGGHLYFPSMPICCPSSSTTVMLRYPPTWSMWIQVHTKLRRTSRNGIQSPNWRGISSLGLQPGVWCRVESYGLGVLAWNDCEIYSRSYEIESIYMPPFRTVTVTCKFLPRFLWAFPDVSYTCYGKYSSWQHRISAIVLYLLAPFFEALANAQSGSSATSILGVHYHYWLNFAGVPEVPASPNFCVTANSTRCFWQGLLCLISRVQLLLPELPFLLPTPSLSSSAASTNIAAATTKVTDAPAALPRASALYPWGPLTTCVSPSLENSGYAIRGRRHRIKLFNRLWAVGPKNWGTLFFALLDCGFIRLIKSSRSPWSLPNCIVYKSL